MLSVPGALSHSVAGKSVHNNKSCTEGLGPHAHLVAEPAVWTGFRPTPHGCHTAQLIWVNCCYMKTPWHSQGLVALIRKSSVTGDTEGAGAELEYLAWSKWGEFPKQLTAGQAAHQHHYQALLPVKSDHRQRAGCSQVVSKKGLDSRESRTHAQLVEYWSL